MVRLDNFECKLINFECLSWVILNVFYNRYVHYVLSENGTVLFIGYYFVKFSTKFVSTIQFLMNWEIR